MLASQKMDQVKWVHQGVKRIEKEFIACWQRSCKTNGYLSFIIVIKTSYNNGSKSLLFNKEI